MKNQEDAWGSGFLITCDKHKQKQAVKDAFNFLGEYIEDIYGDIQTSLIHKQLDKQAKDHNLQNQMHVRATMKGKLRLLSSVDTNVNCLIFIKINEAISDIKIEPSKIVLALMKDVHKQNRQVTRFCHKILPVERSFKAEHFRMLDAIDELFQARDNSQIKSWALNFKCRNNSKFNYKEVLKQTEKIAKKYGHFADIYYPQWTVAVQIVHHLMCLAIVQNYKQFQEFRLHPKGQRPMHTNQISQKSEIIKQKKQQKLKIKQREKSPQIKGEVEELEKQKIEMQQKGSEEEKEKEKRQDEVEKVRSSQLLKQKIRVQENEDVDFI